MKKPLGFVTSSLISRGLAKDQHELGGIFQLLLISFVFTKFLKIVYTYLDKAVIFIWLINALQIDIVVLKSNREPNSCFTCNICLSLTGMRNFTDSITDNVISIT